ncbi:unnamed protein product [Blepharisma stoltei]|uniref:Uncharacterized protein n=1 Tax=Blepharisma stoltei TaxID=1481888 RepID=A0AAU9JVN2_9CILI|nr:unnamed protein product [Blepharisma stoltei]
MGSYSKIRQMQKQLRMKNEDGPVKPSKTTIQAMHSFDSNIKSPLIRKKLISKAKGDDQRTKNSRWGFSLIERPTPKSTEISKVSILKPINDRALEYELAIRSHLRSESYSSSSKRSAVIPLTKAKISNVLPELKNENLNTTWDKHLVKLEKQESQLKKLIKNLDRKKKLIKLSQTPMRSYSPEMVSKDDKIRNVSNSPKKGIGVAKADPIAKRKRIYLK